MTKLAFDLLSDVHAAHPYILVGLLEDDEPRLPSVFDPFMEVSVEKDKTLLLTINQGKKFVALTIEQWEEIAQEARKYHAEILANGDEW
ncbi:hypothetical protein KZJ38_27970 [Paraburkholderia edwinii]|uniref:Pyocin activator protein PrtN n=1 Tax=Paraburkholderia edwinii TaxID=2861782 RepID=A0ABX8V317_9BURK|nr:hypothetical protein [Paraburkholderia edwinii]QYD73465.1 hypothetical protein KZJ38_27970 [Paraburkholderia edwinii]